MKTLYTQSNLERKVHDNEELFTTLQSFLGKKTQVVVSKWTATTFWGFSLEPNTKFFIDVPRGYKPRLPKEVIRKQSNNIYKEIVAVKYGEDTYKFSSLEKTFIDLIKSFKGEYDDTRYKMISEFKKTKYDLNKLLELAKKAKVFGEVNFMMGHIND